MVTASIISKLSALECIVGRQSFFRLYQEIALQRFGKDVGGQVIELGGEKHYRNDLFFPQCRKYVYSNIARDFEIYADLEALPWEDGSQETFICVSVLEHIRCPDRAIDEIHRTLKRGGVIFVTTPFAFPIHDVVDYWRFGPSFYAALEDRFEIVEYIHLGGLISTIVDVLRRPLRK